MNPLLGNAVELRAAGQCMAEHHLGAHAAIIGQRLHRLRAIVAPHEGHVHYQQLVKWSFKVIIICV